MILGFLDERGISLGLFDWLVGWLLLTSYLSLGDQTVFVSEV